MKRISIFVAFLFLTTGCQHLFMERSANVSPAESAIAASVKAPADFTKVIAELEESTKTKNSPNTWLKLSLLYSHHKNPSPDYSQALQALEKYLSLSKGMKQPDYVYDRLTLLKQLVSYHSELSENHSSKDMIELMRQDNRNLMIENQQLKEEKETILNENLAMKQMLDRLGQIELQHEKKRKLIK